MICKDEVRLLLGIPHNTTSHREKIISMLGAGIGIFVVGLSANFVYGADVLNLAGNYILVTSIGASAVLLFALPHGALSQPWAVVGGQLTSAIIGACCYKYIGDTLLAASLAVALSVSAMYYLRCIHPPGGATALYAVIGGESVQNLGFGYILMPVLLNTCLLLLAAVAYNSFFHWRRYPAHLYFKLTKSQSPPPSTREFELTQEDFAAAIQQHDSFIDITDEGLTELLERAKQHAELNITHPTQIVPGKYYSNGRIGHLWSIRQVIDASERNTLPSKDRVIYKVVSGHQSFDTGICTRNEFRSWARFEVIQNNNRWIKVQ